MYKRTIKKWINIKPDMLTKDLTINLQNQLKSFENSCNSKLGYILKVHEIEEIEDNYITNSNSEIMIYVRFVVEYYKPKQDDILNNVVICGIYENGILVEAYNIFKILIPSYKYKDKYQFSKDQLKSKDNVLTKGDKINVKLSAIQYKNHNYNCIGLIA